MPHTNTHRIGPEKSPHNAHGKCRQTHCSLYTFGYESDAQLVDLLRHATWSVLSSFSSTCRTPSYSRPHRVHCLLCERQAGGGNLLTVHRCTQLATQFGQSGIQLPRVRRRPKRSSLRQALLWVGLVHFVVPSDACLRFEANKEDLRWQHSCARRQTEC